MGDGQIQITENDLNLVWNEKNSTIRLKAIENIYVTDANLYHVGDKVTGPNAINDSISDILKNVPLNLNLYSSVP